MRAASLDELLSFGGASCVPGFDTQAALQCLQASTLATTIAA